MADTEPTTVNPSELRAEYGPAPWWSEDHLTELLHYHGLTAAEIADIWPVHADTIRDRVREYGIGRDAA